MEKITLYMIFLITFYGCNREELKPIVKDPQKAILGRWEVIENSLGPVTNASQYEEYLADSVLLIYRYDVEEFIEYKYWFSDSILYKGAIFIDAFKDTVIVTEPYEYKFQSFNKLRMDFQNPAIVNWYIYKRIK